MAVSYASIGTKRITLRAVLEDGTTLETAFPFVVEHLETPIPSDTLAVTASIPYAGAAGTGEAYVHLSPLNTQLTDPVIVIEGFDLDNTFMDATDYIQRNAFVVVELIQQVLGMIDPAAEITLVGPSMGSRRGPPGSRIERLAARAARR